MSKLETMSLIDLKSLKKGAAFRGNIEMEKKIQEEMFRRIREGKVTEDEIIAAAYL